MDGYRLVKKNAAEICMIHTAIMHEMVWFDPNVGVEWETYLADAKLHVKSHPDIPTQSTTALIYS